MNLWKSSKYKKTKQKLLVICLSCGEQVTGDVKYCPHCGKFLNLDPSRHSKSRDYGQRSNWWYALPIVGGIFGGAVAYFVIKNDDPSKAKNCLWLGFIIFAIGIVVGFISG